MFPIQSTTDDSKLYVDDVFSTYLYDGNGTTQTINNGIDLAGKGGMVWTKSRNTATSPTIVDTVRGIASYSMLYTNTTSSAYNGSGGVTAFSTDGYTLGNDVSTGYFNTTNRTYTSWTFRKAPKFFDVVTYTGDGAAQRNITHNLASTVGMIFVKRTDSPSDWCVYYITEGQTGYLVLNSTAAANSVPHPSLGEIWGNPRTAATTTTFSVGGGLNTNGGTYVACLLANDTSTDGIIQCGSFTTDGSGNATVNLGWEPQFVLTKSSSATGNWVMQDAMRGLTENGVSGSGVYLFANLSNAENPSSAPGARPAATGFNFSQGASTNQTFIYLAIRRPNKPPTSGAQVYNAIARTGTGATATVTGVGFTPDAAFIDDRTNGQSADGVNVWDRLRGAQRSLLTPSTAAEASVAGVTGFDVMGGVTLGASTYTNGSSSYINHFFRRAPGFFDVVCYTGTGSAKTEAHNLGVAPELMILKERNQVGSWVVYSGNTTGALVLNTADAEITGNSTFWNSTAPTATVFTIGTSGATNESGATYVAHLFATLPGISKVGSYTGNGTSQTINCGFTTGARFILIKRTDSTGDWYVWDTARGIISANDPHLSLNTTAAEVTTDDSVDPDNSGFIVNQVAATNINVTSASYIFLAVA